MPLHGLTAPPCTANADNLWCGTRQFCPREQFDVDPKTGAPKKTCRMHLDSQKEAAAQRRAEAKEKAERDAEKAEKKRRR